MKPAALIALWLICLPAFAQPHRKMQALAHFGEHLLLGAGTEVVVSQIAGGSRQYWPGIAATGILAAVKEGTDAHDGKDSRKTAAFHALTILGGAGIAAGIKH